ncbi:DUF4272 domain-containing protein [Thalassoroseus pseudoceratinae]|uniref:DUF4272 domain-containing protein n=1 Tax=Thalassoroseus pseudoceratinae TaxID=2713176 RepID=UPI0014214176|nr:DUF4272 domain-containing protein [Thalassoroseus pseudoceratinae]
MTSTKEWAASHDVCVDDTVPPVEVHNEACKRNAHEVAVRTIILQCVAAVGYEVDAEPVIDWLKDQDLWDQVSSKEKAFLCADERSDKERSDARWRQEAQWALLWSIRQIESLGLPTQTCDTARLVDEIMPVLGEPVDPFVSSADLRPPAEILAEDDRIYNLHCYARQAYRRNAMPDDLVYDVLFQRHYAFEWLNGTEDWDAVTTDT